MSGGRGPAPRAPGARRRDPTRVSADALVRAGWLPGAPGLPLVVEPNVEGLDPVGWAEGARPWLEARLLEAGALLFRGFRVPDARAFRAFAAASGGGALLDYVERAAPRTAVAPQVYTSTEFAADQPIPLHHEMSYSHNWPARLWFYCARPAPRGGATPLASEREVTRRLPDGLKRRFVERGLAYVRNYGEGVDLGWREAFQTDDPAEVEAYCRASGAAFEWREGGRLRTRSPRRAMVEHPRTGERLWFNHAYIFHETNLPPEVRASLRARFGPDEMPRNAFYGDGSPIEPEALALVRAAYEAAAVRFDWQEGDVLMVDNVLAAHGRDPFEGPRTVLVAMADLRVSASDEGGGPGPGLGGP
ncbi:MAG TPA: TauD/TfdA family dioxygenase [Polyangiaceae bacterium]|nr:TauD/TfdA family dioxygenase [Polyangiaceae bacterium]